jgi:flagellar basal body rod protein FlgG
MQNQAVYVKGKGGSNSVDYVGTLGLGSQLGPEYVDFEEGALQSTENPLDFAIQGKGGMQRIIWSQ